jgi:hypothetical protein
VRVEGAPNPSDPDAALYDSGALLPGPGAIRAGPTFQQWLDAEHPARDHTIASSGA